ncbi:MAG TPA: DUF2255 domain-containing protein [Anaerolineaceae bacterium]|jgi:hypothetical protein|nr:DUF2255 domain-containing protein [Anaerolineaceae bacterium]
MTTWTKMELDEIGKAEELQLTPLQINGSLGKTTTMWVVRVGDDLYVRAHRGQAGKWYQATQVRREGQVLAAGIQKSVHFLSEADPAVNDLVDAAYRSKYGHYPAAYVDPMVKPGARSTTLKLVPID